MINLKHLKNCTSIQDQLGFEKTLKAKLTFTRVISILFTGFITYIYIRK